MTSPNVSQKSPNLLGLFFFRRTISLMLKISGFLLLMIMSNISLAANTGVSLEYGVNYRKTTPQIGFYYFTTDKESFSLKAGYAESEDDTEKEEQFNFTLGYKKITGTSFYIAFDIGYYYFSEIQDKDAGVTFLFDIEEDFHAIGIGFKIGNEWKVGSDFLMGCDWFGIGTGTAVANRKDDDDDSKVHFTLLNFYTTYLF